MNNCGHAISIKKPTITYLAFLYSLHLLPTCCSGYCVLAATANYKKCNG